MPENCENPINELDSLSIEEKTLAFIVFAGVILQVWHFTSAEVCFNVCNFINHGYIKTGRFLTCLFLVLFSQREQE